MTRKLIAMTLAGALAFTGFSAAPAKALTEEELGQLLGGALTLFILGKALSDANDDKDKDKYNKHSGRKYYDSDRVYRIDPPRKNPPARHHVRRKLLPDQCLRINTASEGPRRYFGKPCLRRNYDYVKSLPERCEIKVRTDRGLRRGYAARCLRREGYMLASRH